MRYQLKLTGTEHKRASFLARNEGFDSIQDRVKHMLSVLPLDSIPVGVQGYPDGTQKTVNVILDKAEKTILAKKIDLTGGTMRGLLRWAAMTQDTTTYI